MNEREKQIKKEDNRLRGLFKALPPDTMKLYDGLIKRAAFMRITLEYYESDLNENGHIEKFSQSEKLVPYERERPTVRMYNTMNKNYQSIMKQLIEAMPEQQLKDAADEIMNFAVCGVK